ncbi:unnamed protein product [Arabidopsis halleri]
MEPSSASLPLTVALEEELPQISTLRVEVNKDKDESVMDILNQQKEVQSGSTDEGLEKRQSDLRVEVSQEASSEAVRSSSQAPQRSWLHVAQKPKILVEADLTKELPKEYILSGEEEGELDVVIKYTYPWLPPHCGCCKKWGHLRDSCLREKQHTALSPKTVTTVEENSQKIASGEICIVAETVEERNEAVTSTERCPKIENRVVSENAKDQDWITPTKTTRSPQKKKEGLNFGEVSILSNSYAALSDELKEDEKTEENVVAVAANGNDGEETEEMEDHSIGTIEPTGKTVRNSPKPSLPPRKSLPRGSKTAHKVVSQPLTQSAKDPSRNLGKKIPSQNH